MKKLRVFLAVALCLVLVLAVQMPSKTVVAAETLSSIQTDNKELYDAISEQIRGLSSFDAFADSVYIIREEYLFKQDKTTYVVPYIRASIDDVGTAGTSSWSFLLDTLVLDKDGTLIENAGRKYNRSATTFVVEADPNTVIEEQTLSDWNGDHVVTIAIEKIRWVLMDEHTFSINASTSDSDKPLNVDSTVSFRWESELTYRLGKALPFVVEATVSYVNNMKG